MFVIRRKDNYNICAYVISDLGDNHRRTFTHTHITLITPTTHMHNTKLLQWITTVYMYHHRDDKHGIYYQI